MKPSRHIVVVVGVVVGAIVALTGCTKAPTNAWPTLQPRDIKGVLVGAWSQPHNGYNHASQMAAVADLESTLGRKLAIDHFFVTEFGPARTWTWRLDVDAHAGRLPMVSFGSGVDTRAVAEGKYDAILRSYARAIAAYGNRALMRYAWEMDGTKNQSWVHSGADYVAAWRHVHAIFQGLPVQWIWAPNAVAFSGAHGGVDQYWPGDRQVDWIGADGYNFFSCMGSGDWRGFQSLFQAFDSWRPDLEQPRMIAEFGTVADAGDPQRKSDWLLGMKTGLKSLSRVKAVVYFDSNTDGCNFTLDARTASPDALQVFRSPEFSAAVSVRR